jgi:flagellar protein FlaG
MDITPTNKIQIRLILEEGIHNSPKKPSKTEEIEGFPKDSIDENIGKGKGEILKLAENLNQFIQRIGYNLQFIPDQKSGTVVIKVLDKEGNLIRQIPPEAFLALSSKIGEHIGILINSKL